MMFLLLSTMQIMSECWKSVFLLLFALTICNFRFDMLHIKQWKVNFKNVSLDVSAIKFAPIYHHVS